MYYRLTIKGKEFHYEEFFASAKPPTQKQIITYYSAPDRSFGDLGDMVQVVLCLLKDERCTFPNVRKQAGVGTSFDAKNLKYVIALQRIEIVPLSEKTDGA